MSIKEVHHPRGVTHGSGRSRGVGAALWEKSRRRASRVPGRDGANTGAHWRYQMQGTAETLPDD